MKLTKIALATAVGVSMLATMGCEQQPDPDRQVMPTKEAVDSAARTAIAQDERELKEELAKLQAKDPSVKDMYYTMGENDQKEVVIVKEVKDERTGETRMSESIFPMMAGMMLGQMMASSMMMNAMAMSQMGNYNPGYGRHSSYSSSEYRQRKNMATSAYAGGMRTRAQSSLGGNRPVSSISARSAGAFHGASSARSSGYSAGG